ncbi:DASH complex subunit ask1 [Orbilia ellipsospora]|uniref:DASH complex subunit ASK1 n=1 Tax=Orbilia ellipsospora TaxID=2528407 RepID=A0AAV9X7I1_9PEZI
MSRPLSQIIQPSGPMAGNPAGQRQMSLTEELERLEQSITLTMQEIDRNFSQCHRIITHSIMPIVDRYAEHSRDLCENISFWKGFFEDSAAIELGVHEQQATAGMIPDETTNYEESTMHEGEQTEATVEGFGDGEGAGGEGEDQTITMQVQDEDTDSTDHELEDESILASMNLTGRDNSSKSSRTGKQPKWAAMQSPYDKLKSEVKRQQEAAAARRRAPVEDSLDESMTPPSLRSGFDALNLNDVISSSAIDIPTTPETLKQKPHRGASRLLDSPEDDSPFAPQTARQIIPSSHRTARRDPILHRAVDTNWRVEATPKRKTPRKPTATVTPKHRVIPTFQDSSPMSSPPPPQITTVFSPINTIKRFNIKPKEKPEAAQKAQAKDPKTPVTARKRWDTLDPKTMTAQDLLLDDEFDDDDDDDFKRLGFSPPVTMQFTLPPSRLMQTPAKQASKMLVNDIMRSAGFRAGFAGGDDTQTTVENSMGDSPSFVARPPLYDSD